MFLKSIKLIDLEKEKKYSFLIPIGSTEQHGPFIPFGTDTYWGEEIIRGIEKNFKDLIIAPTLEYSCSEEHAGFIGTMWLKPETLVSILRDLCDSLSPYAKNIILITSHGGNEVALETFLKESAETVKDTKIHRVTLEGEVLDKELSSLINGPLDDHAGNLEISMMLAVAPEITTIPPSDYPKVPIANPWETGRLIDKSSDGMADNHPRWVTSKEIGSKILSLIIEKAAKDIAAIIG